MQKTERLFAIKRSLTREILGWTGVLLFSVFLTSCGTAETPENAGNRESGRQLRPKIAEGLQLLREKNYEKAGEKIFELLAQDPDDVEALSVMGLVYVKQGRLMDASKLAKRSLEIDPDQSLPYSVLARAKFQTSGFEEALDLARQALRIDSKAFSAYKVIGEVYLRQGLIKDALTVFKEAIKPEPGDPDMLNLLGSGYIKAKQYDNALQILLKAQEIDPNLPGVHFNLALVYAHFQEGKKAMKHIDRAEYLYGEAENKPWMGKTRDIKRLLAKKFKFTADDIVS